jgi:hypothetical protein
MAAVELDRSADLVHVVDREREVREPELVERPA